MFSLNLVDFTLVPITKLSGTLNHVTPLRPLKTVIDNILLEHVGLPWVFFLCCLHWLLFFLFESFCGSFLFTSFSKILILLWLIFCFSSSYESFISFQMSYLFLFSFLLLFSALKHHLFLFSISSFKGFTTFSLVSFSSFLFKNFTHFLINLFPIIFLTWEAPLSCRPFSPLKLVSFQILCWLLRDYISSSSLCA